MQDFLHWLLSADVNKVIELLTLIVVCWSRIASRHEHKTTERIAGNIQGMVKNGVESNHE